MPHRFVVLCRVVGTSLPQLPPSAHARALSCCFCLFPLYLSHSLCLCLSLCLSLFSPPSLSRPTVVSLGEAPRLVTVDPNGHSAWGPYGAKTDDKPYLHVRNGIYYLSWGCFYGISSTPYGPFKFQGSAIATAALDPAFRRPQQQGTPWYGQEDYADRHGSFVTSGGQWFYASNDRSHSTDPGARFAFRDTVVGYVHFRANGTIAPVVINAVGVGQYDGGEHVRIEAENFFEMRGFGDAAGAAANGEFGGVVDKIDLLEHPGRGSGFAVGGRGGDTDGFEMRFPMIQGLPSLHPTFVVNMASSVVGSSHNGRGHNGSSGPARLVVYVTRRGSEGGGRLAVGSCSFEANASANDVLPSFQEVRCASLDLRTDDIRAERGTDISLEWQGGVGSVWNVMIDSFHFEA